MTRDENIEELREKRDAILAEIQEVEEELGQANLTFDTLEACADAGQLPVCPHCDNTLPADLEKVVNIAEKRVDKLENRLENLRSKKEKFEEYIREA